MGHEGKEGKELAEREEVHRKRPCKRGREVQRLWASSLARWGQGGGQPGGFLLLYFRHWGHSEASMCPFCVNTSQECKDGVHLT